MSTERQLRVASAHGVASGYAGGLRAGLTREAAIAELRELAAGHDDLLAEVASVLLVHRPGPVPDGYWFRSAAVELLVEAGADRRVVDRLAAERRARFGLADDA